MEVALGVGFVEFSDFLPECSVPDEKDFGVEGELDDVGVLKLSDFLCDCGVFGTTF